MPQGGAEAALRANGPRQTATAHGLIGYGRDPPAICVINRRPWAVGGRAPYQPQAVGRALLLSSEIGDQRSNDHG
jgi:hypothetical protein